MKQSCIKEYFVPTSLDEALAVLSDYSGKLNVVAGATDLFAEEHSDLDAVLDITKLNLEYVKPEGDWLCVGACSTYSFLLKCPHIAQHFSALRESAAVLADMTIRNIATVGGNICSAVPSGDAIPSVVAMGAEFVLLSKGGSRTVSADDFFTGSRKTVIKKDELLKEIRVPLHKNHAGSAFEKIARNSVDLASANVAAFIQCDGSGVVTQARVAMGAVAATVVRVKKVEGQLIGKKLDEKSVAEACVKIGEEISPISNIRSTKEYRADVGRVLAQRAILRAYAIASK